MQPYGLKHLKKHTKKDKKYKKYNANAKSSERQESKKLTEDNFNTPKTILEELNLDCFWHLHYCDYDDPI